MLYRLLKSMDASRFENQVVCLIHPGPVGEKSSLWAFRCSP